MCGIPPTTPSGLRRLLLCSLRFLLLFFIISGMGLSPLGTAATSGLLYKPQMMDEGDCGAVGGMKIGRGNQSTLRKPAPVPLCPPQIPHDQTQARTRAAAVRSQRLTAWAMARPHGLRLVTLVLRGDPALVRNHPYHSTHPAGPPTLWWPVPNIPS
jgi:hypothetical protein